VSDGSPDPTVRRLRDEISGLDRTIVDAVNARLELVARLKRHKESLGIAFLDPDRERQLMEDLARANSGPLSPEGLRQLYDCLLDLTKREVTRDDGRPQ
jgi:chorismate mutase/prephenate dehydratase